MRAKKPIEQRFLEKVDIGDECWVWTAARSDEGYGIFYGVEKMQKAHRVAYEMFVGPIPEGKVIDHLCFNRSCVRYDHLEPVSIAVNNRRAKSRVSHCPQGHEYTPENTYLRPPHGYRKCRACKLEGERIRRERRR